MVDWWVYWLTDGQKAVNWGEMWGFFEVGKLVAVMVANEVDLMAWPLVDQLAA